MSDRMVCDADRMVTIMMERHGPDHALTKLAITQARHAACYVGEIPAPVVPVDAWGRAYRGPAGDIVGHTEVIS